MRRRASSLDAATTAWINAVVAAGGTVGTAQQGYVDTLIRSLKAHSLWSVSDRIWLHASENAQQATIDIVNLGVATPVSAPTFTANEGYTGNGSSNYLNSGYSGSVNGVNFVRDSCSIHTYVRVSRTTNSLASVGFYDSAATGTAFYFAPFFNSAFSYDTQNAFTLTSAAVADAIGFWTSTRTGSTATAVYKNGSSTAVSTTAIASTALVNLNFYILARNNSATADWFDSDQVSVTAMTAGMTGADALQFRADINAYMTSLGKNVY